MNRSVSGNQAIPMLRRGALQTPFRLLLNKLTGVTYAYAEIVSSNVPTGLTTTTLNLPGTVSLASRLSTVYGGANARTLKWKLTSDGNNAVAIA